VFAFDDEELSDLRHAIRLR